MRRSRNVGFDDLSVPSSSASDVGVGFLDENGNVADANDSDLVPSPFRGGIVVRNTKTPSNPYEIALEGVDVKRMPENEENDQFRNSFNSTMDF